MRRPATAAYHLHVHGHLWRRGWRYRYRQPVFAVARGIAGVDTVGIAANVQEPVDRSVVKYSEYLVWLFLITFSVEIDYRNRIRPVQYF